ncbi:MAG: YdcF family protein [Hyphomicrobiaceae bacterium]|nr:YdcF family protein [Hyphomicrobiaceae bacterium]
MFHAASKLFWLIAQPSSLIAIALVAGLALVWLAPRRAIGGRIIAMGLVALVACGFLPVGNLLIRPLEERFAGVALPPEGTPVAAIIILGGFEDGWVSAGRDGLAVNEAAERLTEGVRLALRYPDAKVVFTGGVGGLIAGGSDAAGPVGRYLSDVGVAPQRILLESKSANTWENALFTRDLVATASGQRFLLVTSAYHMPRAMGVFRRAGFDVWPAPTDYRTRDARDLVRLFTSIPAGLERVDLAAKEWIGLVAYWATGRLDALFPRPDAEPATPRPRA